MSSDWAQTWWRRGSHRQHPNQSLSWGWIRKVRNSRILLKNFLVTDTLTTAFVLLNFLLLIFHSLDVNIKLNDNGRLNVVRKSKPLTVSWFDFLFRYSISPVSDINFGALLVNNKKQKQFTIYNHGKYEFKYTITLMQKDKDNQQGQGRGNRP